MAPDLTLSQSEKRTLQHLADGELPERLGLAEDRAAGVGITKEGACFGA